MGGVYFILVVISHLVLFFNACSSLPLCTDLRSPVVSKTPLEFCRYNGSGCCDSAKDVHLQKQFQSMKISDPACASLLRSILCATCDQFSAELFPVTSEPRSVPILCNSSTSAQGSFCSTVWDTCQNVSIVNSPFATSLLSKAEVSTNSTSSKLTDFWQSKSDFCTAFGGTFTNESICFDGEPVSLNNTKPPAPPNGLCLEKIGNGSYLNMVAHPDGSNRAFFSNQPGKIWLATIPEQGSGGALILDEASPFVDLTDQVHFDISFGMMGMAFHPKFSENGRFFASFNCDKVTSSTCSGRCACNSDVNCDPSKIGSGADHPCRYHTVIAEYSANSTTTDPSSAKTAKPLEVSRIFTVGLPSSSDHGGQILFGPDDGYLYFMTGDGGSRGDPFNFAQNKKSLLGKILRLDIDNIPSAKEISEFGLWGNYSAPRDNPYSEDKELQPEIWALGLRNPWRCSFDSERPSYFMCADVGQDRYEEVDLITKGGNYGWNIYEGPLLFNSNLSLGENTTSIDINLILPVAGYTHNDVNKKEKAAAISGGYFFRSLTDPCTYGSYLYGDLYAGAIWAAAESPENSGKFMTTSVPFGCAHDSPIKCDTVPDSTLAALGYIFSFGQDNNKDIFILTNGGVYRVVRPSRCGYICSKENATTTTTAPTTPSPSSVGSVIDIHGALLMFCGSLMFLLGFLS